MADIVNIVLGYPGEKAAVLANGVLTAKMSWGATWEYLRIVAVVHYPRFSIAGGVSPAQIAFGLCNKAGGGYGRSSVAHFLGWRSNANDWAAISGVGGNTFANIHGFRTSPSEDLLRKQLTHVTSSSLSVSNWGDSTFGSDQNNAVSIGSKQEIISVQFANRSLYVLDFVRATGSVSVFEIAQGIGGLACKLDKQKSVADEILAQPPGLDNAMVPLGGCPSFSAYDQIASPISIDEATHGVLDAVSLSWTNPVVESDPLQIMYIGAARLS